MNLDWKTCFKVGLSIFVLYLCIHFWPTAASLLIKLLSAALPLLLGGALAYVLNILMRFYEKHYFPKAKKAIAHKSRRPVCLIAAIVTLLAIISLVVGLLVPQLVSCVQLLLSSVPSGMAYLIDWVEKHHLLSDELLSSLSSVDWKAQLGKILEVVTSGIGNVMELVLTTVTSIVSVLVTAFLTLVFSFYLLWGKERVGGQVNRLMDHYLPQPLCRKIRTLCKVLDETFHSYIVGQCTEALILGLLCMLGMFLLRLPYATMISALVAFTALIPVAGAYIGAAVGAFMILTVSPVQAVVFLVFILILQQLEGNLIYPRVVGHSIGLPGIWVLASVTIGGGLFGVLGMLLGVPLTATVWKLLKRDMAKK